MKYLLHSILILLISVLALASSCKPEPAKQKYLGTYPLGEIEDYLYFKPGSMWVYECDSTGELDTQLMVSIDTPWTIKTFINYQLLTCKIQSLNEGSTYSSPMPPGDLYYTKEYSYFWSITRYRTNPKNSGGGRDCIFFKPYDSNSLGGLGDSPCRYKGLLTNYTVLGKMYDTVRVFQVQTGGTFPYCKIKSWNVGRLTFYWAKNTGLIRLYVETAYDGTKKAFNFNWNLKSYNLK